MGIREMKKITKDSFVQAEFALSWNSSHAEHNERFLARKINMWRDLFPLGMKEALMGKKVGDIVSFDYEPGHAIPDYLEKNILLLSPKDFQLKEPMEEETVKPRLGRFYPKGCLANVKSIYPQNKYPFRVVDIYEKELLVDLNHPLANYSTNIQVKVLEISKKIGDVGGRCTTWIEEIGDLGPGMQARWNGTPTDFNYPDGFLRENDENDSYFYENPRLVGHVDEQASAFIQQEYLKYLKPGMKVLDLMSSLQSHLPMNMDLKVVGLGLNAEEMKQNQRLEDYIVQDLNSDTSLPFTDFEFDTVLCSLSIEYLIHPNLIIKELARVLKLQGVLLISISNRWFPPKAIRLWSKLHEFERMGLIQEYILGSKSFANLFTTSIRNWWRPESDLRYPELTTSDPIYIVGAEKPLTYKCSHHALGNTGHLK